MNPSDFAEAIGALDLQRPLVVIDLETTNGNVNTARIVQIAYQKWFREGDSSTLTVKNYCRLIDPQAPIDPEAYKVHQISQEMLANEPPFSDVACEILEDIADVDFAGYSVSFDLQILVQEFHRARIKFNHTKAHIIDGYKLWTVLRPRSLTDAVREWVGVELKDAHDAGADVAGTTGVVAGQIEEAIGKGIVNSDGPGSLVEQLGELSYPGRVDLAGRFTRNNEGEILFNFSKNVGQPARGNPGFLNWMLRNDFPLETKMWCRKILRDLSNV